MYGSEKVKGLKAILDRIGSQCSPHVVGKDLLSFYFTRANNRRSCNSNSNHLQSAYQC